MVAKIDHTIVDYEVSTAPSAAATSAEPGAASEPKPATNVVHMHERLKRPEVLHGSTYKIKTPQSEHALYVTINDIVLNPGTPYEKRRPFEIFINSKNMQHFQWIVALTRIISAVFRKGGDAAFLVEELRSVFDPTGGHWDKGRFKNSLVAEIGDVMETHLRAIGIIRDPELSEEQKQLIADKKKEHARRSAAASNAQTGYPPQAQMCGKCFARAVVFSEGCLTCLSCGDSKCG